MVKMRKNNQYEGEAKEIYEGNHYICLDCYNKYLKEKIAKKMRKKMMKI